MGKGGAGKKGGKGVPTERQIFQDERIKGYISQWMNNFGWIVPQQKINNPAGQRLNSSANPRLYIHQNDARPGTQLMEGVEVSFLLYQDERGLGATDCVTRGEGDEEEAAAEEEAPAEEPAEEEAAEEEAAGEEAAEEPAEEEMQQAEEESWEDSGVLSTRRPKAAAAPPKVVGAPKAKAAAQGPVPKISANPPKAVAPKAVAPKAKAEPKSAPEEPEPDFAADAARKRLRKTQRFKGKVAKWSSIFGWITPATKLPEDLQLAMQRFNSGIYVNWRNLQQGVTMEIGLAVDFLIESDENGLVALDVGTSGKAGTKSDPFAEVQKALGGGIGSLKAELERASRQESEKKTSWQAEPAQEEAAETPQEESGYQEEASGQQEGGYDQGYGQEGYDQSHAQEGGDQSWSEAPATEETAEEEPPLPPGWEAIWSDEYESYYYWHKASKTPAWERPTAPIATKVSPKAKAAAAKAESKGKSKGQEQQNGKAKGGKGKPGGPPGLGKQAWQEEEAEEEAEQEEAAEYEEEAPQASKGVKRKGDAGEQAKGWQKGKKAKAWY